MRYYCNICKETITEAEYKYSIQHQGKALCRKHQKTVTSHALRLSEALRKQDIKHTLEYSDGHKHVDIAIPWAKVFVELEGYQHTFNPKQVISDRERDYHSQKEGYYTWRVPNERIDRDVDGVARSIAKLARFMYCKIQEEEKRFTLSGILKIGYKKLSEWADEYEESDYW